MFSEYLKKLLSAGKLSFTLEQARKDLNTTSDSVKSAVYRFKKRGELISPAKGFYVIVPPEHKRLGSLPARELAPLLMDHLGVNYYVGLLSAAQHYGAAHQKPAVFQIVVDKKLKKRLEFGQVCIDHIYKKTTKNLPVKDVMVKTGYLKVASPEVTAMDLIRYSKKSGGLNNVATILSELIESLDPDRLIKLADQSDTIKWLQRLGYILEKIDPMAVESQQKIISAIMDYLPLEDLTFIPLAPKSSITGFPRSKKWKIIENSIIESDL